MKKNLIAPNHDVSDVSRVETIEDLDIKRQEQWSLAVGKFGYGLGNYNKEQLFAEAKLFCEQSAMSMLEAGRRLALIQAREPHGAFLEGLDAIGIPKSTAYPMINAANKFLDECGAPKLPTVGNLGITKMYALARLETSQLDELLEGGELGGLTRESIEEISARELKEKIKELKAENARLKKESQQDLDLKDELLAGKNKKIDELDSKLRAVTDQSRWGEKAEDYLNRLHGIMNRTNQSMNELGEILTGVEGMEVKDWEGSQKVLYEQIAYIIDLARDHVEAIGQRTDFLVPTGNSAFHLLNDIRLVKHGSDEEEGLGIV